VLLNATAVSSTCTYEAALLVTTKMVLLGVDLL